MLSAIASIKSSKQFDIVSKNASKLHSRYFTVLGLSVNSQKIVTNSFAGGVKVERSHDERLFEIQSSFDFIRSSLFFGMKVSKRFNKLSTERNKAKRRIRHLVRNFYNKYFTVASQAENQQKKIIIVVIPKSGFNTMKFSDLENELNRIVIKI